MAIKELVQKSFQKRRSKYGFQQSKEYGLNQALVGEQYINDEESWTGFFNDVPAGPAYANQDSNAFSYNAACPALLAILYA